MWTSCSVWLVATIASASAFSIPQFQHERLLNVLPGDHTYTFGTAASGDSRSPCPALNTLANHGYINRSGKDLTEAMLVSAITEVYKTSDEFARKLASGAIKDLGNQNNPGTINLDNLDKHDVIEHDASLTRDDLVQGDNHSLQPALLKQLLNITQGDTLGVPELGYIRTVREEQSLKAGGKPLSLKQEVLANGESALLLQLFGVKNSGGDLRAPKAPISIWFGEERLPPGFTPQNEITTLSSLSLSLAINGAKGKKPLGRFQTVLNRVLRFFDGDDQTFLHGSFLRK